jgi:hypothetical protein
LWSFDSCAHAPPALLGQNFSIPGQTQAPIWQSVPAAHVFSQVPQFAWSVMRSTQADEAPPSPALQNVWFAVHTHVPP